MISEHAAQSRCRCSTSRARSPSSPAPPARSGAAARSRSARSAASCCSPRARKDELDEVAAEVREVGGEAETIVRRPDSLEDAKAMLDAALEALRPRRPARGRLRHQQARLHPRAGLRGLAGGDGRQCARHLVHGQGGRQLLDRQQGSAARCW